jgi:hypothetical protein
VFVSNEQKLTNHPMLAATAGVSFNALPQKVGVQSLPTTNFFNLNYGFVRLDSAFRDERMRYYASEFIFIEENTNNFGLFNNDEKMYSNNFNFGGGLNSGYGLRVSNDSDAELYFLHSAAFIWSYLDYDQYVPNDFFTKYDRQYKFGEQGTATISYRVNDFWFMDLEYSHTNFYSGMDYWKWLGSWGVDLVLQKWIDVMSPLFVKRFGSAYPIIHFCYKNAISIIMSEIRALKQFYPFDSDYSLLERRIGLKFKFIF